MRRAMLLLAAASVAFAQDPLRAPSDAELPAAIAESTALLVSLQENYVETEPPRTRFRSAEEKKAWQAARQKDLAERSAQVGPVREWPYEGVYRFDGLIPSGYRVGGTAITCWALLESPGFEDDEPRRETFQRGVAFILDALEKDPLLQSGFEGSYDVRGWAHCYGLRVLLRAVERGVLDDATAKLAERRIEALIGALEATAIPVIGGWHYARPPGADAPCSPSTFMTAPILQALFQARSQGFPVSDAVIQRALASLEKGRLETGAFQYGTSEHQTGKGFEHPAGACARMAVCETTLHLAGQGSEARIRAAIEAFLEHWDWLEKRRKKTGTHVPPYMIAPYYFHFAHTYVGQAIEQLPEKDRPALRRRLRGLYWLTRENDGGWNDRVFPRSKAYGTAMAILGLMMPQMPPPARYTGGATSRPK
jgi:hypothetical protein